MCVVIVALLKCVRDMCALCRYGVSVVTSTVALPGASETAFTMKP